MTKFKVLVVDDSAFMRKMIADLIQEDAHFEVIATAKNGLEAIEKAKSLNPDVITMDIQMPELDGLEAVKIIMKEHPTPIIMISTLSQEGAVETIKALEFGAVDFIGKPSGSLSLDIHKIKVKLLEKLHVAASLPKKKKTLHSITSKQISPQPALNKTVIKSTQTSTMSKYIHLVAIGTSTGGPKALHAVLTQLPSSFPAPILVVQHMPPNFTKSLAQRLDSICEIKVVEAEDGNVLQPGVAYIAPGGYHMLVDHYNANEYRIKLSKSEPRSGHRPSVDMMFESLIPITGLKRHAVIMTGMGSDGAKCMLALKQAGAVTTIAESEETCVVYGMPRSAVELGCVSHILPVHEIAKKLIEVVQI